MIKKYLILSFIFLLLGILFYIFEQKVPEINVIEKPLKAIIPYPPEYNFRQTLNDCGPFNVAAIVRALKRKEVSSAEFSEDIGWRLPNNYTIPIGLEKQLEANGLKIQTPKLKSFTEEEKINYLQQELSKNHPIIILGERQEYVDYPYQHYLTLFGFDSKKEEFYVYDSFFKKGEKEGLTSDENGELPGNRTYSNKELLEFWKGGGMYGLYKWYSIVISDEK